MSQITVTSTIGPGQAITAKVFPNLRALHLDIVRGVLTIECTGKQPVDVSLSAVTTLTDTITAGDHVIVAS